MAGQRAGSSLMSVRLVPGRIGYVSQEGSLFPHLDVRANVAFGLPDATQTGAP